MLWEGGYIVFRVKLAQKLTRSLNQYHLASLHHAESSKWLCMELVQAWRGWLGEEVKSLICMAWYLTELSLSVSLHCFPAALLVQGIIAKSQNGANAESQHGSGAVPNLICAARLGAWDRHSLCLSHLGSTCLVDSAAIIVVNCLCLTPVQFFWISQVSPSSLPVVSWC